MGFLFSCQCSQPVPCSRPSHHLPAARRRGPEVEHLVIGPHGAQVGGASVGSDEALDGKLSEM